MGRYLEAKCRVCRREGMKLFLKGKKCYSEKCTFTKRSNPPGMHTRATSKSSYYALQLREKQKVKKMYGILERQFKRFFKTASKSKGVTGRMLIQLLERRLDNIIYRALFVSSREHARQLVSHGFVFIDGKRTTIPSYLVNVNDTIEVKVHDTLKKQLKENIEMESKERSVAKWLKVDHDRFVVNIAQLPEKEDLTLPINEQLIVELYSK